jgi:hypothetical protein
MSHPTPTQSAAHVAGPLKLRLSIGANAAFIYGADANRLSFAEIAFIKSLWDNCAGLNPSALPDVVKALEDAFDGFEDYPEAADGHVAGEFSYRDLRKARAAIANLKGAQ